MSNNKINLLIVDDEEQFLKTISRLLQARDFNVVTAASGEEAIEAARKNPVDIAIVDLRMPGMQGEETLAKLKQEHKYMEVIILTGHGTIQSAIDCTKGGASFFLQKPCDLDQLLEVVAQAYKQRVMNKLKLQKERFEEIISMSETSSSLSMLRRLREIQKEER